MRLLCVTLATAAAVTASAMLATAAVPPLVAADTSRPSAIEISGGTTNMMPAKLAIGLFEDSGKTWMKGSAVPWDMRYRYLTKGWANNWGYGANDGSFALKD